MTTTVRGKILTALMVIAMASTLQLAIGVQQACADTYNVTWSTPEKNSAGQVTGVKATISASGATSYLVNLYKNGKMVDQRTISTATHDVSSLILDEGGYGSGTYRIDGYAYRSGSLVAMLQSADLTLKLHTITIDTAGHGPNVVIRNINDGASAFNVLKYGYIDNLGAGAFPTEFYEDGEALVGVALYPKSHYSSMSELWDQLFYTLPLGGASGTIGGNATLYAIWFEVIDAVELTVTPPACGVQTTTSKSGSEWDWDSQTNCPTLALAAGSHCHFGDGSMASSGYWDADESGSAPYVGTFAGGNSYWFEGYLESDYGYVFPGESDGIPITVTMNGGTFGSWANDSYEEYKLYGKWLDADNGLGTTPLWLTGSVDVVHSWDAGAVTTPADCTNEGVMTYTCAGCNETYTEPIDVDPQAHDWGSGSITKATLDADGNVTGRVCAICGDSQDRTIYHPATFTVSPKSFTYNGSARKPTVTVTDAHGQTIAAEHYTVSYAKNQNAGTAAATVTFQGDYYEGTKNLSFTISKAANPLAAKGKIASVKAAKVKKKAQTLKLAKVVQFTKKGQGTLTYTKKSGNKKIVVNKTNGKVTVKKGLKKGAYKVKVAIKAAGNANYNAKTVNVTFKVKVG